MALPPFADSGDLPVGIHRSTLEEVRLRFGVQNETRRAVFERLEHILAIARNTGHIHRFVVFGSFITSKPHPNDVDVFILMDDDFDFSLVQGEARLLFDHGSAETFFGSSLFWIRRLAAFGGEQETIEGWQTTRDGSKRGIVEIVEDR